MFTAAASDGHEVEAPIVYIETASEHSVDQALALADATATWSGT